MLILTLGEILFNQTPLYHGVESGRSECDWSSETSAEYAMHLLTVSRT